MFNNIKRVLIISPHPDDGVLAMGGTITKLIEQNIEVKYLIFSWEGQEFNKEEIINAIKTLGVKEQNIIFLNYQVRNFNYYNNEIREELLKQKNEYKPDLVFTHNSFDYHQDHKIVCEEAIRVFREGKILGYILPWNLRAFRFDMFFEITGQQLQKKLDATKFLKSQQFRFYYEPERIKATAITMGLFRRKELAEGFEILSLNL